MVINDVKTTGAKPGSAPSKLKANTTYAINGINFGPSSNKGTLSFGSATATVVSWDPTTITFKVSGTQKLAVPIVVNTKGKNASQTPTPQSYTA